MFKEKIKKILNKFDSMLFVNYSCINCGKEIFDNYNFCLCEKCFSKLDIIKFPICQICGESLGNTLKCENCYNKNYHFDKNLSFCYYNDVASNIIKKFKYSNKKFYAKYIANLLFENIEIEKTNIDYITFVPATKSGKKERGYNQSEEMAIEYSKLSNIPVIDFLGKNDGFKNQASLNQKERVENLKNAFFVHDDNKNLLKGKNILIIDDVFTTGTTLSRCAETLKKCKTNKIFTLTFAKTKFDINF